MTVLNFWRITRTNLVLLLSIATIGVLAAFVFSLTRPVVYRAESSAYVAAGAGASASDVSSGTLLAQQKAASYLPLVTSTVVATRVIDALKLDETPDEVAARIHGQVEPDSVLINVEAEGSSPIEARDLASAVISAVAEEAHRLENIGRPDGQPESSVISVVPYDPAQLPTDQASPNIPLNLLLGALLGLAVGYAVALVRRMADSRLRTVSDVEAVSTGSVIGIIPKTPGLRANGRGRALGTAVESFRQVRTNLRFVDVDHPPRSIVVTSANAGEGKSTITSTLARMLADAGQPTLLIDGDLRRPMQAEVWGLDDAVGLTQVLAGDLSTADVIQTTDIHNLSVITAGRIPPNPSELLGSQKMREIIKSLTNDYLVLLDAPPLLPVTDAGLLSAQCDGALLVFAIGRTYREQAAQCQKILDQVGAKTLGVVMNLAPEKGMGSVIYGYGYSSYRQEEYSRELYSRRGRRKGTKRREPRKSRSKADT